MTTPRTQITRYPDGTWVAVAGVPMGNAIYSAREALHEGPIVQEALWQTAQVLGPNLRAENEIHREHINVDVAVRGVETAQGRSSATMTDRAARNLADARIRDTLLGRIKHQIEGISGFARQVYDRSGLPNVSSVGFGPVFAVAGAIGGTLPDQLLHVAIGSAIQALIQGDRETMRVILEAAKRVPGDGKALKFMMELFQHAYGTPALNVLFQLFQQYGMTRFAQAIAALAQAAHPARAG